MKKVLALLAIVVFAFALPACKSKVSDADIKTAVDAKLQANPDYSMLTSDVANGVVTISGDVKDEATKDSVEVALKDVKGVKSVVMNATVAPPPPPPIITADDSLTTAIKDAVKDNPTVTATVSDGVVTLTGDVKKSDLPKLLQKVNATHPKKVENNLNIK